MATVLNHPNPPSDREVIDAVCGGKITPETAVDILRGDGDAKMYLLQKLAGGSLPLAVGVQLEARLAKIAEARAEKRGAGVTAGTLRCKVSAKGALSVYGLHACPSRSTSSNGSGSWPSPRRSASSPRSMTAS